MELAEPGFGSATSALSSAGAPAKRAKAGGARGSLPELVSRLASVLPMARTLPHLRALLSEQQQQKAGAAESSTVSAGAAGEQHATDVKRVKLAAPAIPGLDLVPSEGSEQFMLLNKYCTSTVEYIHVFVLHTVLQLQSTLVVSELLYKCEKRFVFRRSSFSS